MVQLTGCVFCGAKEAKRAATAGIVSPPWKARPSLPLPLVPAAIALGPHKALPQPQQAPLGPTQAPDSGSNEGALTLGHALRPAGWQRAPLALQLHQKQEAHKQPRQATVLHQNISLLSFQGCRGREQVGVIMACLGQSQVATDILHFPTSCFIAFPEQQSALLI